MTIRQWLAVVLTVVAACVVPTAAHAGTAHPECHNGAFSIITGDANVLAEPVAWSWEARNLTLNGAPVVGVVTHDGPNGTERVTVPGAQAGDLVTWRTTLIHGTYVAELGHIDHPWRAEVPACPQPPTTSSTTSTTVPPTSSTSTSTTVPVTSTSTTTTTEAPPTTYPPLPTITYGTATDLGPLPQVLPETI